MADFNDLMKQAAEHASADELVELTVKKARQLIDGLPDGEPYDDLATAIDYAQGDAKDGEPRYVLIKVSA